MNAIDIGANGRGDTAEGHSAPTDERLILRGQVRELAEDLTGVLLVVVVRQSPSIVSAVGFGIELPICRESDETQQVQREENDGEQERIDNCDLCDRDAVQFHHRRSSSNKDSCPSQEYRNLDADPGETEAGLRPTVDFFRDAQSG